jgi:hypothetical protein
MADEMTVASSFIRSNLNRLDSWNNEMADKSGGNDSTLSNLSSI